ncbi:hypothetical protein Acr_06g0013690 [Actinidia rufa]|uniref:2-oxoglutarate (2OG) and Fe(II)-dependent oxygenase superfamily protein n=1 Tax=Actinidia rufa TaxID=165716 RepID=A0A7J0ETX6_9ERIC|nr:hypothetical protein Acr_06g0013690 [Actinidia rufa]
MASPTEVLVQTSAETNPRVPKRTTVKALVESDGLTSSLRTIPMQHTPMNTMLRILIIRIPPLIFPCSTPVILINAPSHPRHRQSLPGVGFLHAGEPWCAETLMKAVLDGCNEFFNLPMEEKMEFATKDIWKPIRFGTGVDIKVRNSSFGGTSSRCLRTLSFTFSAKPQGFSEIAQEYCKRCHEVSMELLKGISESLGFEESYIEKAMNLKSAFNSSPTSSAILSNGRYKSIMHRAVVNNQSIRISIAIPNGPSLDTMVSPAPELVDNESRPAAYIPMKYKDYMDLQLDGKPAWSVFVYPLLNVDGCFSSVLCMGEIR